MFILVGSTKSIRVIIERSIYDYRTCFTGSPPLTGSGIVRIVVLDVNDHIPEFTRQEYRATVTENLASGTWVTKPHATDKDEGLNAKIRYIRNACDLQKENRKKRKNNHDLSKLAVNIESFLSSGTVCWEKIRNVSPWNPKLEKC